MIAFFRRHPSVRILLAYVFFVASWMLYFDFAVRWLGFSTEQLARVNIYSDLAFGLVSVVLLYLMLQTEFSRRRHIEEALRESEELFHALARLSPVGIFRSDAAGQCIYVNEAWCRITGLDAQRALGDGWSQAVHPGDRPAVLASWKRAVADNVSVRIEYRFVRPGGAVSWVLGEVHPERTEKRTGFVGTITDITDRKSTELALRESEQRYRTLVEHIPAVTLTRNLDEAATCVFVSPQIEAMLGFTLDEWRANPRRWFEQLHPEDRTRVMAELLNPAEAHVRSEYRLRHRSGRWVWVRDEAAFLRNEAGQPVFLHGLLLDITQARQLEADLARSHGRYEALVNSLESIVWEMDADSLGYTFVSRQAERLTGYHHERWLREPHFWLNHVHAEDRARAMHSYHETARTLQPAQVEYRFVAAANREIWVRDSIVASVEDEGRVKLRGVIVDVTESRRAAHQVAALNTELEARVKQRTGELETANEELRSFSYSVSHDLRAPLRAVTAFAESLRNERGELLDETGREYLDRILGAARRMGQLIDDILTLSRVTRLELKRETLDLSEIANSVIGVLQQQDPARKVNVRIIPGICVNGDARLLRIMLENLLGNAWKFTSRQPVANIEMGVLRRPNGHRTFFIRDDGAGFDMEYVHKLFGAFQRLHSQSEFPGTGVGLATVMRIVQRHGGKIWAEGREGAGATFFFEL